MKHERKKKDKIDNVTNKEGKYLTFALGNEEYGIVILKVKEIIGMMSITALPLARGSFKGVINLRGKIIPVVDLRLKFLMDEIHYTERSCIIVVEVEGTSKSIMVGLVVDSVSEVLSIKANEIEADPGLGTNADTHFILGIAKMETGIKILLDIDQVVDAQEAAGLSQAA